MLAIWILLIPRVTCFSNTSLGHQNGELRLTGGHQLSGRVEVYLNNEWGTVCDDGWNLADAKVVCRQLGFKGAYLETRKSFFGAGEGPIHFDDVACSGIENSLINCPRAEGQSNCNHDEDAGVICLMSGDGDDEDVRLVSGNSTAGRVEINIKEQWGTICDDFWDIDDATVVCRQLGFSYALAAFGGATFGEGSGHVHIDDVHCHGNETSLAACSISFINNCDHSEDVGVSCAPFQILSNGSQSSVTVNEKGQCYSQGEVRLLNGNSTAGQISVCKDGQWGSICDEHWDLKNAKVVCRHLGFRDFYLLPQHDFYQKIVGHKHLIDINCFGHEPDLLSCNYSRLESCEYEGDARVRCENDMKGNVSLVGGNNTAGRVEIYLGSEWGTICDDDWDLEDAKVVCTQLGFEVAVSALRSAAFGEGKGPIHISAVECSGNESSLIECKYKEDPSCEHYEDSGVVCLDLDVEMKGDVRLVGGNNTAGRVEIYLGSEWGTICDDDWDLEDAKVVCTQLGFEVAVSALRSAAFGEGKGPIHISAVECSGNESSLIECKYKEDPSCEHYEDSGVVCENVNTNLSDPAVVKGMQNLLVGLVAITAVLLLGSCAAIIHQLYKCHHGFTRNEAIRLQRPPSSQRSLPTVPLDKLENKEVTNLSSAAIGELEGKMEDVDPRSCLKAKRVSNASTSHYMTIDVANTSENTLTGGYVPMDGVKTYSERVYNSF